MSLGRKVLLFVALAVAANLVTVALLPQLINRYVMHRIVKQALASAASQDVVQRGGYNVALPAPRATAQARTIVRPSPDLLYTTCVFDVSMRPLRITAPVQDSYVSVSGFDIETNNFFAVNDSALTPGLDGKKRFDLVIARDAAAVVPAGARLVISPSDRGLILFRSLVRRESDLPRLLEFQARQDCRPS